MLPPLDYWYLLSLTAWDFFSKTESKSRDINFAQFTEVFVPSHSLQIYFFTLFSWLSCFSLHEKFTFLSILYKKHPRENLYVFELSKVKVRANHAFFISKVQEFVNQFVVPKMHAERLYSNKFWHDIISEVFPLSWASSPDPQTPLHDTFMMKMGKNGRISQ